MFTNTGSQFKMKQHSAWDLALSGEWPCQEGLSFLLGNELF